MSDVRVVVQMDDETFAIEEIAIITINPITNREEDLDENKFQKASPPMSTEKVRGVYDLASTTAKPLLDRALALVFTSEDNYQYLFGGSTGFHLKLSDILASPLLTHQYSTLLAHDPLYTCYSRIKAERKEQFATYYKFIPKSETMPEFTENATFTFKSYQGAVDKIETDLSLFRDKSGACATISAGLDLDSIVLRQYCVRYYHNAVANADEPYHVDIVLIPNTLLYPELEVCFPVTVK